MSNEKQLGLAFLQYTQDYDEQMPSAAVGVDAAGRTGGWMYYSKYPADSMVGPAGYDPEIRRHLFVCEKRAGVRLPG